MAKRPQTAGEVVSIESLEIPPIGQDPEYAAAVARIEQLHRKKLELEERQARLAGAITASRQSASFHPDQLESQLDQLLSGQTPEGAGSVKDLERELAEVKDSLLIVEKGLDTQHRRIEAEQRSARERLAKRIGPSYHALLQKIAERLNLLDDLLEQAQKFRAELEAKGYTPGGPLPAGDLPNAASGMHRDHLLWFHEHEERISIRPRRGSLSDFASFGGTGRR